MPRRRYGSSDDEEEEEEDVNVEVLMDVYNKVAEPATTDDYQLVVADTHPITAGYGVITLKNKGAELNARMTNGFSPLMWALMRRNEAAAKAMIVHGADVHMPADPTGTSVAKAALLDRALPMTPAFRQFLNDHVGDPFFAQFARTKGDRESTIARAVAAFAERGPMCDTEGYYQHQGECWNDTTQMILMFADGIKEITQPLFLTYTGDDLISAATPNRKNLVVYMDTIRHRFARHYLNEIDRRKRCDLRGSRRARGLNSLTGATAVGAAPLGGVPRELSTVKTYKSGHNTAAILQTLLEVLGLHPRIQLMDAGISQVLTPRPTLAIVLHYIVAAGRAHVNAFYTCGGMDYWYDDNYGVYPMPWRDMLIAQRRGNGTWIVVKHKGLNVAYYPALYFPEDKTILYVDVLKGEYKALKDGEEDGIIERVKAVSLDSIYPIVDTEKGFGPDRDVVLPVIVGRADRFVGPYVHKDLRARQSTPKSEEEALPNLVAASPKPFLLPRKPRTRKASPKKRSDEPKPFLLPRKGAAAAGGGGGRQSGSGRTRRRH